VIDNRTDIDILSGDIANITGDYTDILNQVNINKTNIQNISGDVITNTNQIDINKTNIVTISGDVIDNRTDIDINKTSITIISGDVIDNRTDIDINRTNIVTISGDVIANRTDIDINKTNIQNLSSTVTNINNDYTDVLNQIDINKTNIQNISGDVIDNRTDIDINKTNITIISGDVIDNRTDIDINKTNITTISGDITTISNNYTNIVNQVDINKTNITTISGDVITNSTNITNISRDIIDNRTIINNLSGDINALSAQVTFLEEGGVDTFVELTDTPGAFQDGSYLKSSTNSLQFVDAQTLGADIPVIPNTYGSTDDLPDAYTNKGQIVRVGCELYFACDGQWQTLSELTRNSLTTSDDPAEQIPGCVNNLAELARYESYKEDFLASQLTSSFINGFKGQIEPLTHSVCVYTNSNLSNEKNQATIDETGDKWMLLGSDQTINITATTTPVENGVECAFSHWSSPTATFANATSPTTSVFINSNTDITANFVCTKPGTYAFQIDSAGVDRQPNLGHQGISVPADSFQQIRDQLNSLPHVRRSTFNDSNFYWLFDYGGYSPTGTGREDPRVQSLPTNLFDFSTADSHFSVEHWNAPADSYRGWGEVDGDGQINNWHWINGSETVDLTIDNTTRWDYKTKTPQLNMNLYTNGQLMYKIPCASVAFEAFTGAYTVDVVADAHLVQNSPHNGGLGSAFLWDAYSIEMELVYP
jgi:hypothetical protein